jgi:hypothetical protein
LNCRSVQIKWDIAVSIVRAVIAVPGAIEQSEPRRIYICAASGRVAIATFCV